MRTGYRKAACLIAALSLLTGSCALAQEASPVPQVIEQKLQLLELLLGSARFKQIQDGPDGKARAELQKALQSLDRARAASRAGDFIGATQALDDGLKASTAASALAGKSTPPDAAQLMSQNSDLIEQINNYRKSIADTARQTGKKMPETMDTIGLRMEEARRLSAAERHGDANRLLSEAYQLAVTTLSRLRAGEVVTIDLGSEPPENVFGHTVKRYREHLLQVETMLSDETLYSEDTRRIIEYKVEESRQLMEQAEKQATGGEFPAAIRTMGDATEQLIRALRIGGMPGY